MEPSPDDAATGAMKRTTENSGMKAVGIKRQFTYAGSYDLRQVITCFSMKTLVVMSICFMCFSVNFTFKTHAVGLDEIKEVWYRVDKIIEVALEIAVDGLVEYNRLINEIDDYKLIIICQGGEIYKREYIKTTTRYRDGILDWGEKITVRLEDPSSMGVFVNAVGKFEDYNPETGEWIRDYENLIPRIDWETKYLINGNYSFTKKSI